MENSEFIESLASTVPDLISIDSRSYLEVADHLHRYAKHLRIYYSIYSSVQTSEQADDCDSFGNLFKRFQHFFAWLDGDKKPEIPSCPRAQLDGVRVKYLTTDEERLPYLLRIDSNGKFSRVNSTCSVSTGQDGWIFVVNNDNIYAGEKVTEGSLRFHHSSFFSGQPVQSAGLLVLEDGKLTRLFPHSGHYRPAEHHLLHLLKYLDNCKVDLNETMVDAQRVLKVARSYDTSGGKVKKIDSPFLVNGGFLFDFLVCKALFRNLRIHEGIFDAFVHRHPDFHHHDHVLMIHSEMDTTTTLTSSLEKMIDVDSSDCVENTEYNNIQDSSSLQLSSSISNPLTSSDMNVNENTDEITVDSPISSDPSTSSSVSPHDIPLDCISSQQVDLMLRRTTSLADLWDPTRNLIYL